MIALNVRAIGLLAPGLAGWTASLPVLRGEQPYRAAELPQLKPTWLPASERRRATMVSRFALAAVEDALAALPGGAHPGVASGLMSVFASSSGDMGIIDRICRALQEADRPLSPTHFHNSVHNAPAGYWAIASRSMCASTSLAAFDGSFAAGLLETACLVASQDASVLLVAYDAAAPQPLAAKRPITLPFAAALLCGPVTRERGIVRLELGPAEDAAGSEPADSELAVDSELDSLHRGNPAARSLTLLRVIARDVPGTAVLPGGWPQGLQVKICR